MVIKGWTKKKKKDKKRTMGRKKPRAIGPYIEHWLIREAFLPFVTPRLINRGQVNSAICYFNNVSSYEINVADLDEERILLLRQTSFNLVRSIISWFIPSPDIKLCISLWVREKRIYLEKYIISLHFPANGKRFFYL